MGEGGSRSESGGGAKRVSGGEVTIYPPIRASYATDTHICTGCGFTIEEAIGNLRDILAEHGKELPDYDLENLRVGGRLIAECQEEK